MASISPSSSSLHCASLSNQKPCTCRPQCDVGLQIQALGHAHRIAHGLCQHLCHALHWSICSTTSACLCKIFQ
ncbi:hypothetical protein K432DRAFT_193688 [Lepidopterella palustris CBS 459.81]|uniref:Uncharacterized protein n=1 Tax=Lepidopterella palustris CBS 459.81 TaxID=1314670 RepID=A0A8E2DZU7_9PEZI|nr:hypothetical protein K432DRAFT_193688 [Lepidopterella palustris CBS 459.81]